jgi:hypothetical protein
LILTPLIFLAIFFPFGLYCLLLSRLNRSPHPLLVSGSLDFAGFLFAVSGLVLFGGPYFLTGFHYGSRDLWLYLRYQSLRGQGDRDWYLWLIILASYFAAVLVWSWLLAWSRRRTTAIYNVTPPVLREALERLCAQTGLEMVCVKNRLFLRNLNPHPRVILEVRPFAALRHVTLVWADDQAERRTAIENELARVLAKVGTADYTVGLWLLGLGLLILSGLLIILAFYAYLLFRLVYHFYG